MKTWQKILLGSGIGILVGLFLPLGTGDPNGFLAELSAVVGGIGTYVLIPFVFAQVTMTSTELAQESGGFRFAVQAVAWTVAASLALSALGAVAMLALSPGKIEIFSQSSSLSAAFGQSGLPKVQQVAQSIVSPNALQALAGDVHMLTGAFVFAVVFGLALHYQRAYAKPLLDVADSAAKVFYFMNRFVVEIMVYGTAVLAGIQVMIIRDSKQIVWFAQVLLIVGLLVAFVVFVLYPALIFFVGKRHRPFAWLKHLLAPALVGLFSGNGFVPLGFLMRAGNEDMRLGRRLWGWYFPLASIVGRAGTALVSSACFVVVVHSYTKVDINFLQLLLIVLSSTAISLFVGAVKSGGVVVSLALLSVWYGQGLEQGFQIMQPAAPVLVALAVFLDVATQVFIAYLLSIRGVKGKLDESQPASNKFRDEFILS